MAGLSGRRLRLVHFVAGVVEARSAGPTYTEIMEALPYASRSHIHHDLRLLEKGGYIKIEPRRLGGIEVLKKPPRGGVYRRRCPCCQRDWPKGE